MLDINVNEFVHMCIYQILLKLEMLQTCMCHHPMSFYLIQLKTMLPLQVQMEHVIAKTSNHIFHFHLLQPIHRNIHYQHQDNDHLFLHLANNCQDRLVKTIHLHLF